MTGKNFYTLFITVCLTGYLWIGICLSHQKVPGICIFRQITTLPCPSCGSTRAVISILSGKLKEAFFYNPLGYLLFFGLLSFPFWISYDLITRNFTFLRSYRKAEHLFKQKLIAIVLILLIAINWIWNIFKLR